MSRWPSSRTSPSPLRFAVRSEREDLRRGDSRSAGCVRFVAPTRTCLSRRRRALDPCGLKAVSATVRGLKLGDAPFRRQASHDLTACPASSVWRPLHATRRNRQPSQLEGSGPRAPFVRAGTNGGLEGAVDIGVPRRTAVAGAASWVRLAGSVELVRREGEGESECDEVQCGEGRRGVSRRGVRDAVFAVRRVLVLT